jgi:hypothetical protein
VDYEAMTAGELQKECARRGLPSSRAAKAVMVQRLHDHDAETGTPGETPRGALVEQHVPQTDDTVLAPLPDYVSPARTEEAEPIRAFRKTFDAEPGGPDEETHLACRQATIAAAAETGLRPRGDARLAATDDGVWVYEVSVRQVT